MIAWLFSPVGKALAGVALIGAALLAFNWMLDREFEAGREAERSAARERAMQLIEKRAKDDEEITTMDAQTLCIELGGVWVSDAAGCV